MVADRGCFPQALPKFFSPVGWAAVSWLEGIVESGFCCMDRGSTDIYQLSVDQLREVCTEEGVDSRGSVKELRQAGTPPP